MRFLFGPMGEAGKKDVPFVDDISKEGSLPMCGGQSDSCAAYRKAQGKPEDEPKGKVEERPKRGGGAAKQNKSLN